MANKQKRISLDGPIRRKAGVHGEALEENFLPAISLPWVPLLLDSAIISKDYADFHPKTNEARFLDCVSRLGGFSMLGENGNWRRLLRMATHTEQGWMRDGVPDPVAAKLLPLRKAALDMMGYHGIQEVPYWGVGHHLRVLIYVRTISKTRQESTGQRRSWIGAAKLVPAALSALRGVLWVDDDQIREIHIRTEPTQTPHYRDIWSVRVEECFARSAPAWSMEAPLGELYEGPIE
jgi:hypothetical protein